MTDSDFLTLDQAMLAGDLEIQSNQAWNHFSTWISHARANAKRRKLSFALTPDILTALAAKQNFKCAVSGINFEFKEAVGRDYCRYPFAVSVDRIDGKTGYEPDNVRLVCLIVNLARNNFGDEALVLMARAISKWHS